MAQAENGNTVKVHYTGKLDSGDVFDSSEGRAPLEFKLGEQQVIPGFENGIVGMEIGDKKTVNIPCAEAYGEYRDDMILKAPRDKMPEGYNPQKGEMLQMVRPDGGSMNVVIVDVDDAEVTLDANHPLAGKDLTFDIELVEIA